MPYHFLRNLGFFLLVVMLCLLAFLSVKVSDRTMEQVRKNTSSLISRLDNVNRIENSIQHDTKIEPVQKQDVFAAYNAFSRKIKKLEQVYIARGVVGLEDINFDPHLFAVRQGLVSYVELEHDPVDFKQSLFPQIENHLEKIHLQLMELAYGTQAASAEEQAVLSCMSREVFHELAKLEKTIVAYVQGDTYKIEAIMELLNLASNGIADLETDPEIEQHHNGDEKHHINEISRFSLLVHKLRINLPRIYDFWQTDRNMSTLPEEVEMVGRTWQELDLLKRKLIESEKEYVIVEQNAIELYSKTKRNLLLLLSVGSVLFAVFFAFFINRVLSARLAQLLLGTEKFAKGEMDFRLSLNTRDALGDIARSFNVMADTVSSKERELRDSFELLETSEKLLKKSHDELELRVEERTADLASANAALQLMGNAFAHSLEGIVVIDENGCIVKVNPAAAKIVRCGDDEMVGQSVAVFDSKRYEPEFLDLVLKSLRENGLWDGEVYCRCRDDEVIPLWLSISRMEEETEKRVYYIGSFRDISEHKKQEMLIRHQAMHDSLTGLPNRLLLGDQIQIAIAHSKRRGKKMALLFMDLDNFKPINDTFGHGAGDQVLKGVAQRLKTIFRPEDTVCRVGGDEFIAIIGDLDSSDFALNIAQRILKSFTSPFQVKGENVFIGGSIGLAFYPDDGSDSDALIKNADAAMYFAKEHGKNQVRSYSESMQGKAATSS
ncbi:MAG: diguanylate cyclase [Desulfobulbaceae bacterium]|nr:diguanylate cyclase [Desulfobulbaceae bacterium]